MSPSISASICASISDAEDRLLFVRTYKRISPPDQIQQFESCLAALLKGNRR